MKWLLGMLVFLSLCLNVYLIYDYVRDTNNQKFGQSVNGLLGLKISKTKWSQGFKLFQAKLREDNRSLLEKKYYYINIWTNWCKPCIREMPWLDSIAGSLNKDVGYVFLSDISESVANSSLKKLNYSMKKFVFLNDMNDFVSAICNEQGTKVKMYPMVLILSNKGKVLHYSIGAYSNKREAAGFEKLINSLKQPGNHH
jgi:thiol-disulfide isomerase/thioredoxin